MCGLISKKTTLLVICLLVIIIMCLAACETANSYVSEESVTLSDDVVIPTHSDIVSYTEDTSGNDNSVDLSEGDISQPVSVKSITTFAYKVSFTDALDPSGIYPFGNIIRSKNKLDSYISEIKDHNLYDLEKQVGEHKSFNMVCAEYNDGFFETHALLLLVVQGDVDNPPTINEVTILDNTILVTTTCSVASAPQVYHIFIETDEKALVSAQNIEVLTAQ